jgi:inosine-uridine nucleoside N-ribohydrolase
MKPVIIDVDTGVDDAIAILLALRSQELNVLGITTVSGNVEVDLATKNTLALLDLIDAEEIPVARGMDAPLIRPLVTAKHVHGSHGLGEYKVGASTRSIVQEHGVDFLIRTIKESAEPVTLILLGPLTNMAMALKKDPAIKENIDELIIMGGADAAGGNETPVAEFNIYVDPEAAQIVFESGLPITLVTWDATLHAWLTKNEVERLASSKDKAGKVAAKLIGFLGKVFHREQVPLCDPSAILAALDRSIIEAKQLPIQVETEGRITRGMTVIDTRPNRTAAPDDPRPRVHVAFKVDREKFSRLLMQLLTQSAE